MKASPQKYSQRQAISAAGGLTIVELMVSMTITLLVMSSLVQSIMYTSRGTRDNEIITRANEVSQAILDYMVFDIRLLGAGMPLGQSLFPMQAFLPGAATVPPTANWGNSTYPLGDAPWPILPTSDSTHIHVRLNERGLETVLSAQFDPGSSSTMSVLDLNDFVAGDIVYLYDRRLAGNAGLRGLVTSRSPAANNASGQTPGTLTISATKNVSLNGAVPYVFEAGSSVNRVSTISYVSPSDWSGVQIAISDYDSTPRIIYPSTKFSLVYRDRLGAVVTLPSTVTTAANITSILPSMTDLASVEITVMAQGERKLSNGRVYQSTVSQDVGLRNLLLSHY